MSGSVAVYIDFDNVVISRYNHVHGQQAWHADDPRQHGQSADSNDPIDHRLTAARVDLGAILDFAASFGTVSLSRAYADWSVPANASYRAELMDRSLRLVQLFNASGTKNGADIRLAVDAVEDLMRDPQITHIVLVSGDSDYVPLAQSCKKLGRYVVGIGVTGSTSRALVSACDKFIRYSDLPDVSQPEPRTAKSAGALRSAATKDVGNTRPTPSTKVTQSVAATELLVRAIKVGLEKSDDESVYAASLKSQMQRMDSSFAEKSLGYASFRAFIESRRDHVVSELDGNGQLKVRLSE